MMREIHDYANGHMLISGLDPALDVDGAVEAARQTAEARGRPVVLRYEDGERVLFPQTCAILCGTPYEARLYGDTVNIYRLDAVAPIWVGSGDWDHEAQTIANCDAQLGDTPHDGTDARQRESERIYEALDKALAAATAWYTEGG